MDAYSKKLASKLGISSLTKEQLIRLADWLVFKVELARYNSPRATVEELRSHDSEIIADVLKYL